MAIVHQRYSARFIWPLFLLIQLLFLGFSRCWLGEWLISYERAALMTILEWSFLCGCVCGGDILRLLLFFLLPFISSATPLIRLRSTLPLAKSATIKVCRSTGVPVHEKGYRCMHDILALPPLLPPLPLTFNLFFCSAEMRIVTAKIHEKANKKVTNAMALPCMRCDRPISTPIHTDLLTEEDLLLLALQHQRKNNKKLISFYLCYRSRPPLYISKSA